jgi:hypothetical protein
MSTRGKRYLALVHRLNCVVCQHRHGKKVRASEAHHVEAYRGDHSAFAVAPLCGECHDLLHRMRRRPFYLLHNLDDIKLLAWTAEAVQALWESDR